MILVSCAENSLGLRFNHRRCSRDRALCRDLLEQAGGKLWLARESLGLFGDFPQAELHVVVAPEDTPNGCCCFWEAPAPETNPEKLLLYRWNRDYPSDEKFQFPEGSWHLTEAREFPGFSHPVITAEYYDKGETENG